MYVSERLAEEHALDGFDCGKAVLDRWLKESALDQAKRKYINTWVWTDGFPRVLAYFSLRAHTIERDGVPKRVGRGGPSSIPAILIAKLALDKSLQGQGNGAELLIDALSRCVAGAEAGPAVKLVLVDALDSEAERFYRRYGFTPIADGSRTLYRTIADIEDDLYAAHDPDAVQ